MAEVYNTVAAPLSPIWGLPNKKIINRLGFAGGVGGAGEAGGEEIGYWCWMQELSNLILGCP
ncbi:MAG: hypothetical protein V7K79_01875 [Nostoc sp.]